MRMTKAQWDELIAHAREEAPNECCGYARARDGAVDQVYRAENARKSPYGFAFGFEALQATNELEDEGWEVATYHSHPRSAAVPSQTDINLAQYPSWTWLIVSLEDEPHIRAWRIADGQVDEEQIEVT